MSLIRKIALPSVCFACIASSCAYADDDTDLFLLDIQQLLEVEVTTATKRQHKVENSPSIVTVFTMGDIQKMGVTSLIDVLKHAPGIETSMAPDGHWRVSLRGVRKDGTILLLIDGRTLNDFYDGQAVFDLPLGLIKQVEIIRGPGSALYGTNAVAGVINVITDKVGSKVTAALQTHGGGQLAAQHEFAVDDATLGVNLGYLDSDGANVTDDQDVALAESGTTNRHIQQIHLSSTYKTEALQLDLLALQRKRGPWVGAGLLWAGNTVIDKDHYQFSAKYDWQIKDDVSFLPYFQYDISQYDALNEDVPPGHIILRNAFPNGGYTKEDYKTTTLGLGFDVDWVIHQKTKILTGVSYQDMSMDNYQLLRNYQVIGFVPMNEFANHDNLNYEQRGRGREVVAVYGQGEFEFDALSVTLGWRYDDYSDFGHALNPRLGAVYQPAEQWQFKFLYGGAFRAPTFKELYDNTRIGVDGVSGNTDLQPEETKTWELGGHYQNDFLLAKLNFFYNDATDVIDIFDSQGSGSRGSIENIGDINTVGGEFEITTQVSDSLRFSFNIARYRAEFDWNSSPLFDVVNTYQQTRGQKQLFNQPRTRANLSADWVGERWQFFASLNYGGRASHNNTGALEGLRDLLVEEYLQGNLSLSYRLNDQLNLVLAANNLGPDKNADPSGSTNSDTFGVEGLLQPVETFSLSLTYHF